MTDEPIGIFDSGVGGLTVARAILDRRILGAELAAMLASAAGATR